MALAYLLDPTKQYQNRAGVNNVAGWLEVFRMDTDDRATVYADFSGTLQPEHIMIDNNGRAVLIVESDIPYRVEMYLPNGDLVYTQQPIYTQATGGGVYGVSIVSTDESISIEKTTVGGITQYDLGRAHDSAEALEWFKSSNENISNGVVYPTYVGGTMVTYPNQGLEVFADRCYHITCTIKVDPDGQGAYYDTLSANLMFTDGTDPVTVLRRNYDIDTSVNDPVLCEFSYDFMPSAYGFAYLNIEGVTAFEHVSVDMQVHRVYSGIPYVPGGMATKEWVEDGYQPTLTPGPGITITDENVISAEATQQVQADWAQSDSTAVDFIKNKPDLSQYATTTDLAGKADKVTGATSGDVAVLDANGNLTDTGIASTNLVHDASYVHTDENFTSAEKTKLSGIEAGAEVNVQSDWNQTNVDADDYIKNKPTIPPVVTVDQTYNASSTNAQSGTAVAEAIGTVNEVPASTSTDEGKVLTVDSQGEPVWATAQAPISAGNGVDITNNVVSAKVDGTSVTFNANGELTATASGGGVSDVEVNGTSVVNAQGVAEVTVPTVPALKELVAGSNITITEGANNVTIAATASAQVNSDWNAVSGVAEILNKPNLATVATTGDYGDLSNTPNLATVATSGDYDDLTNKPTIPAAQVNSDWDASTGVAQILNKPSLATVATTGDYSDLNNTPSLATVATTGDYSDLSGTPTLATVATSGDYDDLTNKPTIPAAQVNSDWTASTGVAQILNKPALATVATSGDYGDLSNKPTINNVPAVTSSDDGKVLTADYTGGVASYSWETPTAVPVIGTITI